MRGFKFISTTNKTFSFFWLKVISLSLSIFIILAIVFLQNIGQANAQVASFFPTSCLGGWKNTEKAVGAPDAVKESVPNYSDDNSASISNTVAQIFCGGFKGEIPQDAIQKKIVLKFSWATDEPFLKGENKVIDDTTSTEEGLLNSSDSANAAAVILIDEQLTTPSESVLETDSLTELSQTITEEVLTPEPSIESEPKTQPMPVIPNEPTPVEGVSFIQKIFFANVYAEETDELNKEEVVLKEVKTLTLTSEESPVLIQEMLATTTLEIASSTPAMVLPEAIFEVRYTLNGVEWETLGYVSNITNDVSFEMPIGIFTTIADLERIQIALHTLSTFDASPKIYLDSMWLEVEYENTTHDSLTPPGEKEGDVILSEISYGEMTSVLVSRTLDSAQQSNILELWLYTTELQTEQSLETEELASTTTQPTLEEVMVSLTDIVTEDILQEAVEQSTSTPIQPLEEESIASSTETTLDSIAQEEVLDVKKEIQKEIAPIVLLTKSKSLKKRWLRVADDSLLSQEPHIVFRDGGIFWFGKNNENVWRFNPSASAYDSTSISAGDSSGLYFFSEASEARVLKVDTNRNFLFEDVKIDEK